MAEPHTISKAGAERLRELGGLFRASREAYLETSRESRWEPAPGSGAAAAAVDLPSPDPAIAKPRGESGHRLIAEVVAMYLEATVGHLGGLASLYETREVVFPVAPLLRSIIENCAHVIWVIGTDEGEPSEARLARAYLEELASVWEAKDNAGRLQAKTSESYQRAENIFNELRDLLRARFGASVDDLDKKTLVGQTLPRPTECVIAMYELSHKFGSPIDGRQAEGLYGLLCNMTHPTLYPVRQRRTWSIDPQAGYATANHRVEVAELELQARLALATFYNTMTWVTSYFGWSTSALEDLERKLEKVIPTFFISADA